MHYKTVRCLLAFSMLVVGFAYPAFAQAKSPIPVIYDTDLGEDIDDTWALCFLLNSPEVDLKLVTTGFGNAEAKVKLVAKILTEMGRDDIPIAIGQSTGGWAPNYIDWAKDFDVSRYRGKIYEDGIEKMVEMIMADRTGRLAVFAMGPLQNIAAAVEQEPQIAQRVELIAMAGSIYKGYDGKPEPVAESNVRCRIADSQRVFSTRWKKFVVAPLDTAGLIQLTDERYRHVFESRSPAARVCIDAYEIFEPNVNWANFNTKIESSTLYDTLAVYFAWSDDVVQMERLPLIVDDKGFTRIDKNKGVPAYVATAWKDQAAFEDLLVQRIAGSLPEHGTRLPVVGITASAKQETVGKLIEGPNHRHGEAWAVPVNDQPEWFQLDLGETATVGMLKIAFANGNVWREKFDVQVSTDGRNWSTVLDTIGGGKTRDFESFPFKPVRARYVRVTLKGHGTWHDSPIGAVQVYGLRDSR